MDNFTKQFGTKLISKEGEVDTIATLADVDAVGIYFSAHWCPPCRGFTPKLAEKYKALKDAGKKFEVIFASGDQDETQFKEYYDEMPWLALPFTEKTLIEKLNNYYDCQGIPYLVILDGKTGDLITKKGKAEVSDENYIQSFPWRPQPFGLNFFPEEIQKNVGGDKVKTTDIFANNDAVGIYFSAHWCPPCRGFTPTLIKNYNILKKADKKIEIIFVSSDKDEASFKDYFKDMSFCALPYKFRKEKEKLAKHFDCSGIPYLVFIETKTLKTITTNGRGSISCETFVEDFPFYPKSSYDLSESMDGLMTETCFVIFTDEQDSNVKKYVYDLVREVADADKDNDQNFIKKWFTANGSSGIEGQMRPSFGLEIKLTKHECETPQMVPEIDNVGPYSMGWVCNGCRKHGPATEANYRCIKCQYDLCNVCYERVQAMTGDEAVDVPPMFILDFSGRKYYRPEEGKCEVTKENIAALIKGVQSGIISHRNLEL